MPRLPDSRRDFPGRRWLNVSLRSLHLAGVVLLGAALLGAGDTDPGGWLMLSSGLAMFASDLLTQPGHLREVAGVGILLKLLLVALLLALPALAVPLFWTLLLASTLLSHAPGGFRHRRLF